MTTDEQNDPLNLRHADQILKDIYGPALEEQLRSQQDIFLKLGRPTPTLDIRPVWKRKLLNLHERLNDCYMHLRYGVCDEEREWNEHIC